jgi:antitoxin YefM
MWYKEIFMVTLNASRARQRLFELLRGVIDKNQTCRIVYKTGEAVLLSEDEYDSMVETLYLLSSPGFKKAFSKARDDIKRGKTVPWRLALGARRAKV